MHIFFYILQPFQFRFYKRNFNKSQLLFCLSKSFCKSLMWNICHEIALFVLFFPMIFLLLGFLAQIQSQNSWAEDFHVFAECGDVFFNYFDCFNCQWNRWNSLIQDISYSSTLAQISNFRPKVSLIKDILLYPSPL